MDAYARAVPPPETARWPATGRAAALFVGVPLTAALVLAAAPLAEPPLTPSALPAAVSPRGTRIEAPALRGDCDQPTDAVGSPRTRATPRAPRVGAAPPPVVVTPHVVTAPPTVPSAHVVSAAHVAAPARFAPAVRAAGQAPASTVTIAPGVERVELQSP